MTREDRSVCVKALTARERQVALLIVDEALSNREIAARLSLAPKTVEVHRYNLYQALDVHRTMELAHVVAAHREEFERGSNGR